MTANTTSASRQVLAGFYLATELVVLALAIALAFLTPIEHVTVIEKPHGPRFERTPLVCALERVACTDLIARGPHKLEI